MSVPDPVCAFHGLKASEHVCLYCCLCFRTLTADECYVDSDGDRWDVCRECASVEAARIAAGSADRQETR